MSPETIKSTLNDVLENQNNFQFVTTVVFTEGTVMYSQRINYIGDKAVGLHFDEGPNGPEDRDVPFTDIEEVKPYSMQVENLRC